MAASDRSDELRAWLAAQRDLTLLMAHDVRNPVAALLANLSYLELAVSPDDRDALEALSDMRRSSEQVLRMVENQVAIARLEADPVGSEYASMPVAIGDLMAQSVRRFGALLEEAGIAFEYEDLSGAAAVMGDSSAVETLCDNLVSLVIQHVPRGRAARVAMTADDTRVTISLDDEGSPFGPDDRDFSREGQLTLKSLSDTRYARGLGLYVIGLVARSMDGAIDTGTDDHRAHLEIVFPRSAA